MTTALEDALLLRLKKKKKVSKNKQTTVVDFK